MRILLPGALWGQVHKETQPESGPQPALEVLIRLNSPLCLKLVSCRVLRLSLKTEAMGFASQVKLGWRLGQAGVDKAKLRKKASSGCSSEWLG